MQQGHLLQQRHYCNKGNYCEAKLSRHEEILQMGAVVRAERYSRVQNSGARLCHGPQPEKGFAMGRSLRNHNTDLFELLRLTDCRSVASALQCATVELAALDW